MNVRIVTEEEIEDEPVLDQVVTPELAELIKSTMKKKVVNVTRAVTKTQRNPSAKRQSASAKDSSAKKKSASAKASSDKKNTTQVLKKPRR